MTGSASRPASSLPPEASATEPVMVEGHWHGVHHHRLDPLYVAFLEAVAHGRLLAGRCARCATLELPPRPRCGRCMEPVEDLHDVGPDGRLLALTILYVPMGGMEDVPGAIGAVQPDGASTGVLTRLTGVDSSSVESPATLIGARCRLQVAEIPQGHWDDFWYSIDRNDEEG